MAVKFDIGNGTTVHVSDNSHPMDTQRGIVAADQVVQGDKIRHINGEMRCEVVAPPAVS
jgi:hypothetical protein